MTVEFTGQDLAEAIAAAAGALNLPPEKLKFNLIDMGAKGFLGLGRRPARIAVDPADPMLDLPEDQEPSPAPEVPEAPPAPEAAPEAAPPLSEATLPEPEGTPSPEAAPPEPRPKGPTPGAKATKPGRAAGPAAAAPPLDLPALTRPAPGETRVDDPDDEAARLARTVVTDILSRLGLRAEMTLARLGSRLLVNLDGPDRALLIGSRGATLEALSLLAAKIMAKKSPDEGGRLLLDVADYRFRRHTQVMENLRREVETARRTGQPQPLTGLNSAERRLVRLALKPVKDLELKPGRGQEGLVLAPLAGSGPGPGKRRKKAKGGAR